VILIADEDTDTRFGWQSCDRVGSKQFQGTGKLDVDTLQTPKGPFAWLIPGGICECGSGMQKAAGY
jgi:hypothetical protein